MTNPNPVAPSDTQALSGVTILDFTQVLAGPAATMQLALLGARVIKVEQPGAGDQMRGLLTTRNDGLSPAFQTSNLNKLSITLNLKSEGATSVIEALVPHVDVVAENFKAGTMDRLGLGYERLRALRPDLVYCSISGYGQRGPGAGAAAYDGAIQAASGMMRQTGHPETGPTRTGYMPCDMGTALHAAFAITAALLRRERTGQGQYLDVAMQDTAIVMQAAQYANYMNEGTRIGLQGNLSATRAPTADVYPTADGYLQITAIRDNQVAALFYAIGIVDRLSEAEFATESARVEHGDLVRGAVAAALAAHGTKHWHAALSEVGVPVAEVRDIPDVIADPQFEAREVFQAVPRPDDPARTSHVVTAGYLADRDGPAIHKPAPLLGADTRQILLEAGFDERGIETLHRDGTI